MATKTWDRWSEGGEISAVTNECANENERHKHLHSWQFQDGIDDGFSLVGESQKIILLEELEGQLYENALGKCRNIPHFPPSTFSYQACESWTYTGTGVGEWRGLTAIRSRQNMETSDGRIWTHKKRRSQEKRRSRCGYAFCYEQHRSQNELRRAT